MPHLDVFVEVERMKGAPLAELDREEVKLRVEYARRWLDTCAPEDYKYVLQIEKVPEVVKDFSSAQKEALADILTYVKSQKTLDGAKLHEKLHEIKQARGIAPADLFSAIYLSFLGRDSGPQAGWFLSVLGRAFLERRLGEVAKA